MAATPGSTGSPSVTGKPQGADVERNRVLPPRPLPAAPHEIGHHAAEALGWHGTVLPEMRVLGRKVCMVGRLRPDAHAERIATGVEPVIDRTSVATWTWPEMTDTAPAPAMEISGVLAVTRHWRTALAWVVPFVQYYRAAVVLPAEAALTHDYVNNFLPRARVHAVSVLTVDEDGQVQRDLICGADPVSPDEEPIARWLNELSYEQLLGTAEVPATAE